MDNGCAGADWSNTSKSRFLLRRKSCMLLLSQQLLGGSKWSGICLVYHCDNHAVVDIWQKKKTKDKLLMQIVRLVDLIAAKKTLLPQSRIFMVVARLNTLADTLSREQMERFNILTTLPDRKPTPLPTNWESLWTTTFGDFNMQQ